MNGYCEEMIGNQKLLIFLIIKNKTKKSLMKSMNVCIKVGLFHNFMGL